MKQRQTHRHREQTRGGQAGGDGGGRGWEVGISRCKLIYTGRINRAFLYSTGDYIQYPVINHIGNGYEKGWIYVPESLCCRPETNPTVSISCFEIHVFQSQMFKSHHIFKHRSPLLTLSVLFQTPKQDSGFLPPISGVLPLDFSPH